MAVTVAELVARLTADTTGFTRGMDAAMRTVEQSSSRLKSFGDNASALGRKMSLGITLPIAAAAAAGFRELEQSQRQLAITEAHIKSTGGAANVTSEHIQKMAEKLMLLSGTDDELIASGSNMLLTFKAVRNETGKGNNVFDRATKAALDLSYQFGSVDSAAKMLGKALQDPEKGITALKKAGVDLSDQQKAQIKYFMAAGDTLSAQKIILSEVESQVGKTADAYGKTLGGQVAIAKESLKNASADIVAIAAPAIKGLANILHDVAKFLQGMPDWAKTAFAGLATGAAILGPLLWIVGGIAKNLAAIQAFRAGSALVGLKGAAGAAGAGTVVAGGGVAAGSGALLGGGIMGPVAGVAAIAAFAEIFGAIHDSQIEKTFKAVVEGSKNAKKEMKELAENFEGWRRSAEAGGLLQANNMQHLETSTRQVTDAVKALGKESPAMAANFIKMAEAAGFPRDVVMQLRAALGSVSGKFHSVITSDISDALHKASILAAAYQGLNFGYGNVSFQGILASRGMGSAQFNLLASYAAAAAGRQHGGPVSPGRPYIVGEAGPELMIPSGSGTIVPNHALGMGGGSVTVIVQGSVVTEGRLIDKIHEGLLAKKRKSGGLNL